MASEYEVERRLVIAAPPSAVYDRIVDFRRWVAWSPWEDLDPNLERDYGDPSAGPGASYAWKGNRKAGQGRMVIIDVEPERRVTVEVTFLKPFTSTSTSTFSLQPEDAGTLVTWTMRGPHSIFSRVMGVFSSMDKLIGKDFEKGLARLKADAERG